MDYVCKVYAKAIIAGDKSIDDVPKRLIERVEYWIEELSPKNEYMDEVNEDGGQ